MKPKFYSPNLQIAFRNSVRSDTTTWN